MAYVPPWKRKQASAEAPATAPLSTSPPTRTTPSLVNTAFSPRTPRGPAAPGEELYTIKSIVARLGGQKSGTLQVLGYSFVEEGRKDSGPKLSVKELLERDRAGTSSISSSASSPTLDGLSISDPTASTSDPPRTILYTYPSHPHSTLLSWIHVIPGAHPLFNAKDHWELWMHTSAEVITDDERNRGRPIPLFGVEKGYVEETTVNGVNGGGSRGGMRGGGVMRGGMRGAAFANDSRSRKAGLDDQLAFMGWWVIKTFRKVESGSPELLEMFEMKEKAKNYGNAGRSQASWAKAMSEHWVKVRLVKHYPSPTERRLINPMDKEWTTVEEDLQPESGKYPKRLAQLGESRDIDKVKEGADAERGDDQGERKQEGNDAGEQIGDLSKGAKKVKRAVGWEEYVLEIIKEAKGADEKEKEVPPDSRASSAS